MPASSASTSRRRDRAASAPRLLICRSSSSFRRSPSSVRSCAASRSASRCSACSRSAARGRAPRCARGRTVGRCDRRGHKGNKGRRGRRTPGRLSATSPGASPEPRAPTSLRRSVFHLSLRYRQAEVLQHGRRDVHDRAARRQRRAVRDQRAGGRLVVVRAMVAGPLLHVRVDDARRRAAERRLPGHPVAVGEPDLQLGGVLQIGPV